jgi:hypothetical protein
VHMWAKSGVSLCSGGTGLAVLTPSTSLTSPSDTLSEDMPHYLFSVVFASQLCICIGCHTRCRRVAVTLFNGSHMRAPWTQNMSHGTTRHISRKFCRGISNDHKFVFIRQLSLCNLWPGAGGSHQRVHEMASSQILPVHRPSMTETPLGHMHC